ncbi:PAS domain-containing sensor histidine kinase [Mucilaginibacter sp.]
MKEKIKILHLEDSQFDAELVARELKRGKINPEILVVSNKATFINALNSFSYDVILSDHSLASFNSLEAIRLVRQAGITVPFLLVTATMTDVFAAKVMKEGACDYILKDRLHRLPSAVINSIEKHALKENHQAAHEMLAFHIENTPLGFIVWDNLMHVKVLSKKAEEIFGWSLKEFSENERNSFSQVYDEDFLIATKASEDLMNGIVQRNTTQHRNITKDGKIIWCEWFNSVLKDSDGKIISIMSLVQDITDSKTFAEKLEYNQSRLKEAQAIAHIGNFDVDLLNNSEAWSDEMYEILGITREETNPSFALFLSFVHPADLNYIKSEFAEYSTSFTNTTLAFRFIRKDGAIRHGCSEARFEFNENQKAIRLFGIFQDVTDVNLAEIERTKMVNDIMMRNTELEQFSYIISHNLRAPVANILGAANALNDAELSFDDKEILFRGIKTSVIRLDDVVNDLNHILQAKDEVNETKEIVHFSALVESIKISIDNFIDKYGIEIKYDFVEINEFVTLRAYLYSIFYNLISNSIKYRRPQVHCIIEIKSRLKKNKLEFIFMDNGMGIDLAKNGSNIFGLYKRFHTNIEGKGMGLFMVKTQVEILGGKISVQSVPNEGTEFKIEFEL